MPTKQLNDPDADEKYAPKPHLAGTHDDLGVHPEQREAEIDDLEKAFAAPSTPDDTVGSGYAGKVGNKELADKENEAANDTAGNGFNPKNTKKPKSIASKTEWWKRKAAIFGATGTLLGGGLFGFGATTVVPLAHGIHDSKVLQGVFEGSNDDSQSMLGKAWRYYRIAKARSLTENRLGALGSKVFNSTLENLAKNGVTIESGVIGLPTRTNIDTGKLKSLYPELEKMSDDQVKTFLADKLKVSPSAISGSGTKFSIDQRDYSVQETRLLTGNTIANMADGKTPTSIKARFAFKAWKLPSALHPMDRKVANEMRSKLLAGGTPAEADKAGATAEKTKVETLMEPLNAKGATAVEEIKSKSSTYRSVAASALLFTGGVCMVRDVANSVVEVNQAQVAEPAAVQAMRMIAIGEQTEAGGNDVTMEELGQIDKVKGKDFETGAAFDQLARGEHATGAKDINPDYQQAFSDDTTAANIKKFASEALGGEAAAGAACSKVGIGIQIVGGVALSIGSVVAEIGSAGTLTPAIVAGWAAKEGVSVAVSAIAMHFIDQFIISKTTSKLEADAFNGPEGASLLAYGARYAANIGALAAGGVSLGNKTSTRGLAEYQQRLNDEFQSKSFFARTFDVYNDRSLAGRFVLNISPSITENIATVSRSFFNFSQMLPNMFASLMPKAAAATTYNWTFAQIGQPDNIKTDPKLQDPYANVDIVENVLNQSCLDNGEVNTDCDYAQRIEACFGNVLDYQDGHWDAKPDHDVDTHSEDYISHNCNDYGTPNDTAAGNATGTWRRIIVFVNSFGTMYAADCYQGHIDSCQGTQ